MTVNYQEFYITWNDTMAGDKAEVPCMGPGLNGQNYTLPFVAVYLSCAYTQLHT